MKTFEKNAHIDTLLSAGLLAIGVAWVALAAAQAPATAQLARTIPAYAAARTTLHAQDRNAGVSSAASSQGHLQVS